MRKVDRRCLTGVLWDIGTALLLLLLILLLHETHVNAREPLLRRFRAINTHRCTDQSYWQEARANLTHFKSSVLFSRERAEALNRGDFPSLDVILSCPIDRPLQRYGRGDGSKLLCRIRDAREGSPCVIYSVGNHGSNQFQETILRHTTCDVHTFGCGQRGPAIRSSRHHHHKWCIGSGSSSIHRSWGNVTQILGHTRVDLLNIAVEGMEYAVLASLTRTDQLPSELSLGFHPSTKQGLMTAGELGLVFLHLANLGYGAYAREINEYYHNATAEYAFMLVPTSGCYHKSP